MPEYDFLRPLREDLEQIEREMAAPGVRDAIQQLAVRLSTSDDMLLAAMWRTSKRHGETLGVFAGELNEQFQRDTGRQEPAGQEPAGQAPGGAEPSLPAPH